MVQTIATKTTNHFFSKRSDFRMLVVQQCEHRFQASFIGEAKLFIVFTRGVSTSYQHDISQCTKYNILQRITLHRIALHHTKRASLVEEARDILDTGFAESFELDCAFARGLSAETITSGSHCYNAGTDEMLQSSR
jgi:hypothetical protein